MSLMVEKLAYLKKSCRMTTEQVSQLCHIPVGTLNKIFSGQTKHPTAEHIYRIARVFHVSVRYLLDDELPTDCCFSAQAEDSLLTLSADEVSLITQYRCLDDSDKHALSAVAAVLQAPTGLLAGTVPVRRTVCCSTSTLEDPNHTLRSILLPATDPAVLQADFTVLLEGDCMEPLYPAGSVLLCRQGAVGRTDYCLYQLNGALLPRRLVRRRGATRLVSPNLEYKDIVVEDGDFLDCLGVILGLVPSYSWG